jgi:putative flippase GtrA
VDNEVKIKVPLGPQLVKFCLVGFANATVDFSIYLSLTRNFQFWAKWYLAANIIAFAFASLFSFIVNKHWTFGAGKSRNYWQEYCRFMAVNLVALLIVEASLFAAVDLFGVYDLWGKCFGILLSIAWSLTAHRRWTFK